MTTAEKIAALSKMAAEGNIDALNNLGNEYWNIYLQCVREEHGADFVIRQAGTIPDDVKYYKLAMDCWYKAAKHGSAEGKTNYVETYKIFSKNLQASMWKRDYDIVFQSPETLPKLSGEKSDGCYIATCVYGSYDCPEVWTLRRYRDYTLAATWLGRMFVYTYYAISPALVSWLGEKKWFRQMWRRRLDLFVAKLRESGVKDTIYEDRFWV